MLLNYLCHNLIQLLNILHQELKKVKKYQFLIKFKKKFNESSHFIIEQMVTNKKYKETLFIQSFKYDIKISCSNFNKINEEKIQKRNNLN